MKTIKRGCKIWCRAQIRDYIHQFEVYQRKSTNVTGGVMESFVLGGKAISKPFRINKKHHMLYFDHYFSSVSLLHYLLQKSTYACCTVRPDREFLPKLKADKE